MAQSRRRPVTVEELQARLSADKVFQEQKRQRDAELQARVAAVAEALRPLKEELHTMGIEGISKLQVGIDTKAAPYPAAVPVLLKHLQLPYPPRAKALIAACLGIPEARIGWNILVSEYRSQEDNYTRGILANALVGAANDEVAEGLMDLVRDPSNGSSRIVLLDGLLSLRDPRAKATIREMRHDPELKQAVEVILKKLNRKNH
jgi:hypothetical protein